MLKNILFSAIVLVAFFATGEVLLAIAGVRPSISTEDPFFGFAGNVPLFVEEKGEDGKSVLRTADNKRLLFNRQEFPKEKGDNSYRVFCMGGSTTYGRPYFDLVSFCGWLRVYLQAADPGRDWEVINAGGASYASYRVANLMNELAQYQPDLFIVYSGQNEFLEERSYGGMASLPGWLIDLNAVLSNTRVYTAMSRVVDIIKPGSSRMARQENVLNGEVDEILNHTVGPKSYHRDDVLRQQIIMHYRLNLKRMVGLAHNAGAGIVFVKPAINIKDMSPFKSEHRAGLDGQALDEWQALFEQATALENGGDLAGALEVYHKLLAIDDRHAETHYRAGKVLFGLEQYDEAERSFRRAVEEDVAPLRILADMQQIVTETAEAEDVPLVDFPAILRQAYRERYDHAVFGEEFFVDHVHTNKDGYRLLGLALFDELVSLGIAAPDASWNQAKIDAVSRDLLAELNLGDEGDALMKLGKVMEWSGKFEEAYALFQDARDILGNAPQVLDRLAKTAYVLGRYDDAQQHLTDILSMVPNARGVHDKLAMIAAHRGDIDQAIHHSEAELSLSQDNVKVRAQLASYLEAKGDDTGALDMYLEVLEARPDLALAHVKVAGLLMKLGRYREALQHGRKALCIDPGLQASREIVEEIARWQGTFTDSKQGPAGALRVDITACGRGGVGHT